MRKASDLMKDLGFREDGSDEVKAAFIRNLVKAAYGVDVGNPYSSEKLQTKQMDLRPQAPVRSGEQLSFAFGEEEPSGPLPKRKSG